MNAASWILLFTKWPLVLDSAACSTAGYSKSVLDKHKSLFRKLGVTTELPPCYSRLTSKFTARFEWQLACVGATWMPIVSDRVSE